MSSFVFGFYDLDSVEFESTDVSDEGMLGCKSRAEGRGEPARDLGWKMRIVKNPGENSSQSNFYLKKRRKIYVILKFIQLF